MASFSEKRYEGTGVFIDVEASHGSAKRCLFFFSQLLVDGLFVLTVVPTCYFHVFRLKYISITPHEFIVVVIT